MHEEKSTDRENAWSGITGVYIPPPLFNLAESARAKLGMSRSRFYQYAITRLLQELSLLTTKVHEDEKKAKGNEGPRS